MVLSMAPVEKLLQPVHSSLTTGSLVKPRAPSVAQRTMRQRQKQSDAHYSKVNRRTPTCRGWDSNYKKRHVAFIVGW
jgi:hypothetical protein